MLLVSFDIDGTLIAGDPPGPISLDMVREAKRRGHVIGSASDRTLGEQRRLWENAAIVADFVSLKHHLKANTEQFGCDRHIHIGDSPADEYYARLAGFEFVHVDALPPPATPGWVY